MASVSLERHPRLDSWIEIGTDGRILLRTGKVDIGQRISTALAMIAAEELDVDPSMIDVVRTETGRDPDEGITSGSYSMEQSGNALRHAAATARRHMVARAAEALGVDRADLEIDDGVIRARDTNRSVSYAELQGGQPFGIAVDPDAAVKAPSSYRFIGTAATPRGMADIVSGRYEFLHDLKLPDMLHARVVRPPHYHARLKALDDGVAERLAGCDISLVRDGSFLAVAGRDEYAVIRAVDTVAAAAEWNLGEGLEPQDVYERLWTNPRVSLPVVDGAPVEEPVPVPTPPPEGAMVTLSARYEKPYHMHGSIGPSAAMAWWRDNRLEIRSHSQGVYILRDAISEALGIAAEDIRIRHAPGAGCYGHNGADDAALDAALVARALPGSPVLLKWTREEEHGWEPYGTCTSMDLRASLDAGGRVVQWSHESCGDSYALRPRSGPGRAGAARLLSSRYLPDPPPAFLPGPAMGRHLGIHRNLDPLYDFAGRRLVKHLVRGLPLRTSALRSLGGYANVFAIECFIDELAAMAGIDPVAFRLSHLRDERARRTISEAAELMAGWPAAESRGRGLGFARYKNVQAYAAVAVELEVTDAAEVKLHRMALAADAGEVVDRAGLAAQIEGGALQAASWTLYEEVTFDGGGITSRDWETYPILRFDNVPAITTVLLDRPGDPFLGAGETVCGPTAAAIGNAVFDATGLRLRRIPFVPDAIRTAAMAG